MVTGGSAPVSRRIAIAVLAVLPATLALARPDSRTMSCDEAAGLVRSEGAIVLSTGANTYDRFVANASRCFPGEVAVKAYVPTRDASKCAVGSLCREPFFERSDR